MHGIAVDLRLHNGGLFCCYLLPHATAAAAQQQQKQQQQQLLGISSVFRCHAQGLVFGQSSGF